MEGTRLRILQLLQKYNSYTVDGLAKSIGLAPATIRRHLDILQRDQLVSYEEVRKRTGRPEYSFYLTEAGQEALPKNYDRLLGMLVQELSALNAEDTREMNGQQILKFVFKRLADEVATSYEAEFADKDLGQRLAVLTRHLQQNDFSPQAEVSGGDLRILLHNCPFRSVALQNPEVCGFDHNLISSVLGRQFKRSHCINDGDGGCCYTTELAAGEPEQLLATLSA
jgi:predicted ArsR family transcriptional regulator